jgi:hypothetical protein
MRRELKLLLIEMNVLRVEVEQLRSIEREARNTEEFLSACQPDQGEPRTLATRSGTPPRADRASAAMVAILVALR